MYNFEIWLVALTWQCGQSCYVCFFLFVLLLVLHHHHHLLRLVTFLNVYIANSLGLFSYRFVFSVYFVEEINGKEPKKKSPSKWLQNKHAWQCSLAQPLNCVCVLHLTSITLQARSLAPSCVCRCSCTLCVYVCEFQRFSD